MSKFWKVGNRDDSLSYYVFAPNKEMAVKVVEDLIGPMNPARRRVSELPAMPEGYGGANFVASATPQILEEEE